MFFLLFSKQISNEILINSSAENVWAIITDFENFPNWNPFIKTASGKIKVGARLKFFIQPLGGKGMTLSQ